MITKEELTRNADKYRANPMPSELEALRLLREAGYKGNNLIFQKTFGFYILDIVIPSKCLVIEIDGTSHERKHRYDAKRDVFCNKAGLRVLRIGDNRLDELVELVNSYSDIPAYKDKLATAYGYAAAERAQAEKFKSNYKKPKAISPYKPYKSTTGKR